MVLFILISNVVTYVVQLKSKKIFSVQTIARTITKGTSTDLERLRAIWIWLCHNIGQSPSQSLLQQCLGELSDSYNALISFHKC